MSLLQESVDALTAAAGWKKASPGADGVFRFGLEGDLDMEFFSPERCIRDRDLSMDENNVGRCKGEIVPILFVVCARKTRCV